MSLSQLRIFTLVIVAKVILLATQNSQKRTAVVNSVAFISRDWWGNAQRKTNAVTRKKIEKWKSIRH
jgi:predicted SpoU family rRNA methylase